MKRIVRRILEAVLEQLMNGDAMLSVETKLLMVIILLIVLLLGLVACSYRGSVQSDLRYQLAPSQLPLQNDGHPSIASPASKQRQHVQLRSSSPG